MNDKLYSYLNCAWCTQTPCCIWNIKWIIMLLGEGKQRLCSSYVFQVFKGRWMLWPTLYGSTVKVEGSTRVTSLILLRCREKRQISLKLADIAVHELQKRIFPVYNVTKIGWTYLVSSNLCYCMVLLRWLSRLLLDLFLNNYCKFYLVTKYFLIKWCFIWFKA